LSSSHVNEVYEKKRINCASENSPKIEIASCPPDGYNIEKTSRRGGIMKYVPYCILTLGLCSAAWAGVILQQAAPQQAPQKVDQNILTTFVDSDGDGVEESKDNCPGVANADQKDVDQNGVGDECPVQITGNGAYFCARLDGGKVKCWGDNSQGNLGLGHTADQASPMALLVFSKFKQVVATTAASDFRTCGIVETPAGDSVMCWGLELKIGNYDELPVQVAGISHAQDLSLGLHHICEATTAGKVYCWGNNESGQCGQPLSKTFVDTPSEVPGLTNVRQVAAGRSHTCALTDSDEAYCWGENLPNPAPYKSSVKKLIALDRLTCAIPKNEGTVDCWGTGGADVDATFHGVKEIVRVEPSDYCSLNNDGTVACGTFINTTGLKDVDHIAGATLGTLCALKKDGSVWCSGWNNHGQLGCGTINSLLSDPGKVQF
jgi:alpha-tubulin suppressor-like RCC1 family protein